MALLVRLRREPVAERHLLPQSLGLIRQHARSADPIVEQAARRERRVANHLGRQPDAWTARQQPILRILLEQRRRRSSTTGGRSPTSRSAAASREHPSRSGRTPWPASRAARDGRRLALHAEILLRLDDAGAEVHLPEPIDRDARRQRMIRAATSHCASVSRLSGASFGSGGSIAGTPGRPSPSDCDNRRARARSVSRGFFISAITIVVGIELRRDRLSAARAPSARRAARAASRARRR